MATTNPILAAAITNNLPHHDISHEQEVEDAHEYLSEPVLATTDTDSISETF